VAIGRNSTNVTNAIQFPVVGFAAPTSGTYSAYVSMSASLSILPTLEADLDRFECALHNSVKTDLDFLTEVAQHLIAAGGKRVRPGFAIACAASTSKVPQPASDKVIMGGVAVELVHQGSLYHDDVMDEATTRRSVESVNSRWGNMVAILSGDYLLGRASEIASDLGTDVSRILARTISRLCEGQIRELESTYVADRTEDDYLLSIEGKTASLLEAACRIGALASGQNEQTVETLGQFGLSYGMAFQIVDDILDLTATTEEAGKPTGNDLLEGNYTLPVLRELTGPRGDELRALLTKGISADERDQARELIRSGTGLQESLAEARRWADLAAASLEPLPQNPGAQALRAASDDLLARVNAV